MLHLWPSWSLRSLGALTILGLFLLLPKDAHAPSAPLPSSGTSAAPPVVPASSDVTRSSDPIAKQARDCLYTLELARAQLNIQELARTARSGEQLEVESRDALDRARRYADRIGDGVASPLDEQRWLVVADGMPVLVVDEATGAVTTYENEALCP